MITVKQHRKDFPQIYEVICGEKRKFRVMARKRGYVGPAEERYDTLKEAKERASEIASKVKTVGVTEAAITVHDRHWIIQGKKMLAPYQVTFEECFKREVEYQKELLLHNTHPTVGELAPQWYQFKLKGDYTKLRKDTLNQIKRTSRILVRLWGNRIISTIKKADILEWLNADPTWSTRTRINSRVHVHGFFQWVIDERGYIKDNPAAFKIDADGDQDNKVEILPVEETKLILKTCIVTDVDLLHYLLLGFFAGLRPREAQRMTVKNVANGHIDIERWMTKVKDARLIEIHPTLKAWLTKYPLPKRANIVPSNFRKRFDRLRAICGYKHWSFNPNGKKKWIQDGVRHTFASNLLAITGERAKLAEYMGTSMTMIKQHYRLPITKPQGEEYFKILPELIEEEIRKDAEKVIDIVPLKIDEIIFPMAEFQV